MSYTRRKMLGATPADYAQMASTAKAVTQNLSAVGKALEAAREVVTDPALPEASCRVLQLYAVRKKKPVPPCPNLARSRSPQSVISTAIPALRAWVFAEQNPWVKPAAVAAVIGVPLLLGVLIGRSTR